MLKKLRQWSGHLIRSYWHYLMVSVTVSLIAYVFFNHLNHQYLHQALDQFAKRMSQQIQTQLTLYQYGLRGLTGSVETVGIENYNRTYYRRYMATRDVLHEFPGARGFGVVRRVKNSETKRFIDAAIDDDRPGFRLIEIQPNSGDRWIIHYIESNQFLRINEAEGLDLASETVRKKALITAIKTGSPVLTDPITLVQGGFRKEGGFLLIRPLYQPHAKLDTPEHKLAAATGLTYVLLHIDTIFKSLTLPHPNISIEMSNESSAGGKQIFFSNAKPTDEFNIAVNQRFTIWGKTWNLRMQTHRAGLRHLQPYSPVLNAIGTFFISLLLLTVFHFYRVSVLNERELRAKQKFLSQIIHSSTDGIIGKDMHGVIHSWNSSASRMFGFDSEEVIGRSATELLIPDDLIGLEHRNLSLVSQGKEIPPAISRRKTKSGQEIMVSVSYSPIFDEHEKPSGSSVLVQDLSELQKQQIKIQQLNETLEERVLERTRALSVAHQTIKTVLDAMPSLVGIWSQDCTNIFANRAYVDWFGIRPEMLVGKHIRSLLGDQVYALNQQHIDRVLSGEAQSFIRLIPKPKGEGTRSAVVHYLPRMIDGEQSGFYAILHDVTELEESRRNIESLQNKQFQQEKLASLGLMVAGVAHEMNTPIGATMLTLEKMQEIVSKLRLSAESEGVSTVVQKQLERVGEGLLLSNSYLTRTAEIIRLFKQVSTDRASNDIREFDVVQLIRDVVKLLSSQIKKHNVQLTFEMPSQMLMTSLPGVLGQVMQNLIENAMLHAFTLQSSNQREIKITVGTEGAEQLYVSVSDNGYGIAEEYVSKIWDPFFTTKRHSGGTGLGLHIVFTQVTTLLLGTVSYKKLEPGSEFKVVLPIVRA
jgi:PAS domain S-box-containing protein